MGERDGEVERTQEMKREESKKGSRVKDLEHLKWNCEGHSRIMAHEASFRASRLIAFRSVPMETAVLF